MPQTPMPLSDRSLNILNCDTIKYFKAIERMDCPNKQYVANATNTLAQIEWIMDKLQEEVKRGNLPVVREGILWLQIYLLMSCADALGHVLIPAGGVEKRSKEFFLSLPEKAKTNLITNLLVWETNSEELFRKGIDNRDPTQQEICSALQNKTEGDKFDAIYEFLWSVRNLYTHETDYPLHGMHPTLSTLQDGTVEPITFISNHRNNKHIFYAYHCNNTPQIIFDAVLMGLGNIIGTIQ